ncbi:Bacterial Ig-like domain (group 2) [compost metagenome]
MTTKKVGWNATTRVATVLLTATALPGGSVSAGTYTHPDPTDALGRDQYGHVTFHHVQELLYKFADEQDMQSVTIVDNSRVQSTGLTVTPGDLLMAVGGTAQLAPVIAPAGADEQRLTYTTDGSLIAEVSNKGEVQAYAVGKTNLTVRTIDGSMATVTIPVEVVSNLVLVDSITLPAPDITLTVAAPTFQLVPTVLPADATRPAVTYVSSDPTKATVDADGLVTRVANGTTNITVSATDGSGETVVKLVTCTA